MTLAYIVRPISDRTSFTGPPASGSRNPFEAPWSATLQLLERELAYLGGERVVLELDVRDQDLKIDGTLRANARAESSPAVRLAFESVHGPLVYGTDRYGWDYSDRPLAGGWQQNARAIALGMEALRRVDRYGITKRGEQYRGFRALESGGSPAGDLDIHSAVQLLFQEADVQDDIADYDLAWIARRARKNAHPDRHNTARTHWDAVEQAVATLQRAGKLS